MNLKEFKGIEIHTEIVLSGNPVANKVDYFTNLHQALTFHLMNRKQGHGSYMKVSNDKYVSEESGTVYEFKPVGKVTIQKASIEDYEEMLANQINQLKDEDAEVLGREVLKLISNK